MSERSLNPSRSKLHQVFVSAGSREGAYGSGKDGKSSPTAIAVDAALLMNRAVFPSHDAEIVTDEGKVSGKPGIARTQAVTEGSMLDFGIDQVTFFELGFLLAYLFGPQAKTPIFLDEDKTVQNNDDTPGTTTQANASKYLKFIFTPPDASDIFPESFILEHWKKPASQNNDPIDMARYLGGYIDSLSLTMNRGGNRLLNASGQMGFKSRQAFEGAIGGDGMPAYPTQNQGFVKALNEKPINAAKGTVWLYQTKTTGTSGDQRYFAKNPSDLRNLGGSAINPFRPSIHQYNASSDPFEISKAAQSATLNWNHNTSRGYRPGGGKEISVVRRSDPTRTLDLSLEYKNQAEVKALNDQTDYALQWDIFGDALKTSDFTALTDPAPAHTASYDTPAPSNTDKSAQRGAMNIVPRFGLSLIIPRMRIATYNEGEDEGIVNQDINFTIMDDVAGKAEHAIYAILWLESPASGTPNNYEFGKLITA